MIGLGDLPGGEFSSDAWDVSGDGSIVVGVGITDTAESEAFRWTTETDMVGLGFLPGGSGFSGATSISNNGAVIVGTSESTGLERLAFRWTAETGMIAIGDFIALAVSDDGSLVVGTQYIDPIGDRAILWDDTNGARRLQDILETDFALDLRGWTLEYAWDISGDGTVIVGSGVNPFGQTEGWIAVIPEPSTVLLLMPGLLLILRGRTCTRWTA
jgi:probable HAF family extracellular repeat protein